MTTVDQPRALARNDIAATIELALIEGDLSQLSTEQRASHYFKVCESLGLNPYTKPFEYLELDAPGGGKRLTLYTRKDCTDQLRVKRGVTITRLEHQKTEDLYIVTAYGADGTGRQDSAIGAVPIAKEGGFWEDVKSRDGKVVMGDNNKPKRRFVADGTFTVIRGEALANAIMKAETKAKRRLTLSLCGLGMTDESELEGIPGARVVEADLPRQPTTVVITQQSAPAPPPEMVTSADHRVWQRWLEVLAEAQGLGIRVEQIRLPMQLAELKARGTEVFDAITARRAQLAEQEAAAAAEPATSDDTSGETLPSFGDEPETAARSAEPTRAELWQENRRLVAEATERGIAGVPTLGNRSGEDVLVAANAELAQRIQNHRLDQEALRASGQTAAF